MVLYTIISHYWAHLTSFYTAGVARDFEFIIKGGSCWLFEVIVCYSWRPVSLTKSFLPFPCIIILHMFWFLPRLLLLYAFLRIFFWFVSTSIFLTCYGSLGLMFENSCEIGVFSKLTNAYCLVAIGGSENFYRFFLFPFLFPGCVSVSFELEVISHKYFHV